MYNRSTFEKAMLDILDQREAIALRSIKSLIDNGWIMVEKSDPVIYQDEQRGELRLAHPITLVVNDKYTENLERINKELSDKLDAITKAIGGVK